MDGRKEGWTDGRTDRHIDRYSNGHRGTDTKQKEIAIPSVASSLNQQELAGLDYKYFTSVAEYFFSLMMLGSGLKYVSVPFSQINFHPLKAELNPICHFLALLGAHHILHISRTRVKL